MLAPVWGSQSWLQAGLPVKLEFRAEVFNVMNTPPFNDPNGSFGTAGFDSINV
jgi:hypothetical protein